MFAARMPAAQFVLAEGVEQIELHREAHGLRSALHPVDRIAFDRGAIVRQHAVVVGRTQAEAALDPSLEDGAGMSVAVHTPAGEKSHVAVPEARARRGPVLVPLVQAKLHREVIVKNLATLLGVGRRIQLSEKPAVGRAGAVDFERLRPLLEFARSDDPGRQVATIQA